MVSAKKAKSTWVVPFMSSGGIRTSCACRQ